MEACTACQKPVQEFIYLDAIKPMRFCSEECRALHVDDDEYALMQEEDNAYWSSEQQFYCYECQEYVNHGFYRFSKQWPVCAYCLSELQVWEGPILDVTDLEDIKEFVRYNGTHKWFPLTHHD